jgi:transcription elongation factor GreB
MTNAFAGKPDPEVASGATVRIQAPTEAGRNLLTPAGAARLRAELHQLHKVERPALATSPENAVTRHQLQIVDQRIRYLQERLTSADIVLPPRERRDVVRFGATVTIEDEDGEVTTYRLVGVDEAQPQEGSISWVSPVGRSLLNRRSGERVTFRTPVGDREFLILHVEY